MLTAQTRWGEGRCSVNSVLIRKIKQREPSACGLVYLLNFSTWRLLGTENLAHWTQNVDSTPPHPASPHVFPSQETAPPAQLLQPDTPPWTPIPLPSSPTSSTAGPGQSQQSGCGLWPGSVSPLPPTPNLSSWSPVSLLRSKESHLCSMSTRPHTGMEVVDSPSTC